MVPARETMLEVEGQNYIPPIAAMVANMYKERASEETDEAIMESSMEKLCRVLDVYEAHLTKNKYLAAQKP